MVQLCISQKLNQNRDCSVKVRAIAGANLFKLFTVKFLTQQVRASEDKEHVKFIASFTNCLHPITPEVVSKFQQYNQELIERDPAFADAPICCATNAERYFWLDHRATSICRKENKILYKFFNPYRLPTGGYEPLNEHGVPTRSYDEEIDNKRQGFSENFFHGAKGIITQNLKSHNKSLLLANGTPCRYYGITFCPEHDILVNRALENCVENNGVKKVLVPQPKYIHVFVDGEFIIRIGNKHFTVTNSDFKNQMCAKHKVGDAVEVLWNDMFTKQHTRLRQWDMYKRAKIISVIRNGIICPCSYSSKVDAKDPVRRMSVALAYAFTFNKLQGLTLNRLVLSIGENPGFIKSIIRLAHVYVAMSRVMASKYLALLPAKSYAYLYKLKYPPTIMKWANNYDNNGKWQEGNVDVADVTERLATCPSLEGLTRPELQEIVQMLGETMWGKTDSQLRRILQPWYVQAHIGNDPGKKTFKRKATSDIGCSNKFMRTAKRHRGNNASTVSSHQIPGKNRLQLQSPHSTLTTNQQNSTPTITLHSRPLPITSAPLLPSASSIPSRATKSVTKRSKRSTLSNTAIHSTPPCDPNRLLQMYQQEVAKIPANTVIRLYDDYYYNIRFMEKQYHCNCSGHAIKCLMHPYVYINNTAWNNIENVTLLQPKVRQRRMLPYDERTNPYVKWNRDSGPPFWHNRSTTFIIDAIKYMLPQAKIELRFNNDCMQSNDAMHLFFSRSGIQEWQTRYNNNLLGFVCYKYGNPTGHFTVLKPVYYLVGNSIRWKWFYLDSFDKNHFYLQNKLPRVRELTPQRAAQYYRKFRKSNTNSQFSNHILPFSMSYDISLRYAAIA